MIKEISAGAIIFRQERGTAKYLLLHYPSAAHRSRRDYWDFVKGHIESGESEADTVLREANEETGLDDLVFIEGFREPMRYFFRYENKLVFKKVVFYLAKTGSEKINLSGEHDGFAWLPYKDAYAALSFKNAKSVFKKAHNFLEKSKMI